MTKETLMKLSDVAYKWLTPVVSSGDADKTVIISLNPNGSSNSLGRGSITAVRIA